jgi:hypothetical protein
MPLNLPGSGCDQERDRHTATNLFGGYIFMKSVRPDNTNPIPLRSAPPRMGTLMIRFVGLLVVAVGVLALIWSR